MTRRTILAIVLGSFLVLANAAPSPAYGWRHFFGDGSGSCGGCCGLFSRNVGVVEDDNNCAATAVACQTYVAMRQFMPCQGDIIIAAPGTPTTNACENRVASTPITSSDGVPGTLGLTYQRRTKRVNSDIHPRVGLLEITVSDETVRNLPSGHEIKVIVEDEAGHFEELEGYFGEDDKWHFESKPLYPGIPHIYDVKFEEIKIEVKRERRYDRLVESEVEKKFGDLGVRRVRLIPGRTVFLSYP